MENNPHPFSYLSHFLGQEPGQVPLEERRVPPGQQQGQLELREQCRGRPCRLASGPVAWIEETVKMHRGEQHNKYSLEEMAWTVGPVSLQPLPSGQFHGQVWRCRSLGFSPGSRGSSCFLVPLSFVSCLFCSGENKSSAPLPPITLKAT